MKKDPVMIGVASVLVIAFTLSLLNIYVFPDIFFNIKIDRNTDNEFQLGLLEVAEKLNFNAEIFAGINFSEITVGSPENSIINITYMIELAQEKKSAAFDNQEDIIPRRIKLKYNGTIVGVGNVSQPYEDWIETQFAYENLATYLAFKNPASNFEVFSNFTIEDVDPFDLTNVFNALQDIFTTPSIMPDYVIYQTVQYTESRGMFNEYSTEFERIIFIDTFGEVLFFLTNEGDWTTPFLS